MEDKARKTSGVFRDKRRLLRLGGIGICVIVLGELFARFYLGLGDPPLSVAHPTIEYMFKPNQDVYRFGNRQLYNRYGMRSPYFDREKSDDELRILVIGDSVVNGGNLTDHSELATTIIADRLSSKLRKPVIVGNISAGSWGPGNWLAYVQEYGFFDADLVVLVVSSHDIADNPSFAPLNPDTHPTSRPFSALSEAVTRYLPKYLPKARSGRTEERETLEPEGSESPQLKGMSDLREFLTLATSHCKCVYVVQHLERSEIEKDQKKPGYNAIRELCGNLEIECDSLEMAFKDSLKKGVSPYRPNDNIHPNEIGQALIADVLIEIIERFLEEQELSP